MEKKSRSTRRDPRFVRDLLSWWEQNGREFPWRRTSDPFQVLIAEILLQRSRSGSVTKVYEKIFDLWPTASDIAKAEPYEIEQVIGPLGLKSRASRLQAVALAWIDREKVPRNEEELLEIPGIGPYTASATAIAMAWDSHPCVDSVSVRVVRRFLGDDSCTLTDLQAADSFYSMVSKRRWNRMNWAILDLAAAVCMPRIPRCQICPIAKQCKWAQPD